MCKENSISMAVNVKRCTIEKAPNYNDLEVKPKTLKMHTVIVVEKGTVNGKATLDLQMKDEEGNDYLVVTTNSIFKNIVTIANATEE